MSRLGTCAAALSVVALLVAVTPTACSASKTCSPGQSIACTGPGGCAGGQACTADGSGYEACVCGGTDSGTQNDGSTDGSLPTHGALHVTWTITNGGNTTTCAAVGASTVDILLTSSADAGVTDKTFPCTAGTADVTGLAFDTYAASISLLDAQSQVLSSGAPGNVTLGPTGCDSIIGGDCAKNLNVSFKF